jgi:hypothetical protein
MSCMSFKYDEEIHHILWNVSNYLYICTSCGDNDYNLKFDIDCSIVSNHHLDIERAKEYTIEFVPHMVQT